MFASISARLLVLLMLAAPLAASEHVKLKNGTVLNGRATAYDSAKKLLSFKSDDGQTKQYTLDQLDQRSVYMVNASLIAKDNGRGQLQLANYARDIGLYAQAGRRYGYAEQADPSLKVEVERERSAGRKLAADYCLKNAKDFLAQDKVKDAEYWLSLLVQKLPNEPQAEEAARLLEQYYLKERNARDDKVESEQSELLEKDLKKGKGLYDRMIERTRDGLTARSESKAEKLFEGAIDDGHDVLGEIERLAKKYPDDARVQDGALKYRQLTIEQMVDAHLHLASQYTVHSSYQKALKETNAALALDPKNAQALSQRARIEQASSEGLGLDLF
jgi:hypothetical protein